MLRAGWVVPTIKEGWKDLRQQGDTRLRPMYRCSFRRFEGSVDPVQNRGKSALGIDPTQQFHSLMRNVYRSHIFSINGEEEGWSHRGADPLQNLLCQPEPFRCLASGRLFCTPPHPKKKRVTLTPPSTRLASDREKRTFPESFEESID